MPSIEEKVEEQYKKELEKLGVRHYGKTETINDTITNALKNAVSKSGGSETIILTFSYYWKTIIAVEFLL